ncbi:GntR family transcriptional regulator [Roseospira navarrensis]|uniref:GntR family transcriptional regulator n=1 Tax=Roseospira navarrensis TaxID=140058 RepID=A0A7X2D4F3_9PROT|nr:GntR family transcriptional regulator [Roseospira navarrensis]MQX37806.1 GntR family transcriptional regulator [Roseospira navarrensis]
MTLPPDDPDGAASTDAEAVAPSASGSDPRTGSLADRATATLRDRILDLTLKPGRRIDERHLMEQFGISRTPAREAMNRLVAEGLVQIEANRGAFVRPLDVEDLANFFDIYFAAERMCAHFCRFDHPGFAADMRAIQDRHATAVAAHRFLDVTLANAQFHMRIAEASENAYLIEFAGRIHNLARRVAYFVYHIEGEDLTFLSGQQDHIISEHSEIIGFIAHADRPGLMTSLTDHARRFQDRLSHCLSGARGTDFKPL